LALFARWVFEEKFHSDFQIRQPAGHPPFPMRTTFLVCYDIANEKRLRRVFKICKNYGNHLQFSVFECDLNPTERIQLEKKLGEVMKLDEDQALFVSLGPSEGGRPGDCGTGPALHAA
jgi:CRISPR-associated protein Cas2